MTARKCAKTVVARRYAEVVVLFLLIQSCDLLKNTKTSTSNELHSLSVQEKGKLDMLHISQTDQHFFEWKLDSLNSSSTLQIWPKGKFKFSLENGFEGEAEKIVLNSTSQQSGTAIRLKDSLVNTSDQLKAAIEVKKTLKAKETQTVKTETPAFWLITGLVILAIAGVIIYKFLKP